ncbi:uncharacterized protein [Ambystoma mexicanum]|uniref:uncharacterized protein n=1 Tax=Ambystoma mexicanum TaxID=8296 RepID=UPI0037E8B95C
METAVDTAEGCLHAACPSRQDRSKLNYWQRLRPAVHQANPSRGSSRPGKHGIFPTQVKKTSGGLQDSRNSQNKGRTRVATDAQRTEDPEPDLGEVVHWHTKHSDSTHQSTNFLAVTTESVWSVHTVEAQEEEDWGTHLPHTTGAPCQIAIGTQVLGTSKLPNLQRRQRQRCWQRTACPLQSQRNFDEYTSSDDSTHLMSLHHHSQNRASPMVCQSSSVIATAAATPHPQAAQPLSQPAGPSWLEQPEWVCEFLQQQRLMVETVAEVRHNIT